MEVLGKSNKGLGRKLVKQLKNSYCDCMYQT